MNRPARPSSGPRLGRPKRLVDEVLDAIRALGGEPTVSRLVARTHRSTRRVRDAVDELARVGRVRWVDACQRGTMMDLDDHSARRVALVVEAAS